MNDKKSEKSFLKKTSDVIAWLCWIILAWMFFMAFHDEYEWNFRFLFNIFPDSNWWYIFLYLAPFGIIWLLFKLLWKGFNVKFGEKNQTLKNRSVAFEKRFFALGKYPHIKYFFICGGIFLFIIYLIVFNLDSMFKINSWHWLLSIPIGALIVIGLIILCLNIYSTVEIVKWGEKRMQMADELDDIKEN